MRIHGVQPHTLIEQTADKLAAIDELSQPVWAQFAKTGPHRERPPAQDNWWHIRAASVLRQVALKGPIGVNKLRVHYGGRKNRGHKPDKTVRAGGKSIRSVLQQLEAAGLVKQDTVHGHKGRVITPKGQALLDKTANEVLA